MRASREPVVITGLGLVCSLGAGADAAWAAARAGRPGLREMTAIECGGAGPGGQVDLGDGDPTPDGETARETCLLLAALREAWASAGLTGPAATPERTGVVLGTTLAGMPRAGEFFRGAPAQVMQRFLAGAIAARVAEACGARGACFSVSAACASGLSSIAHAVVLLETGEADLVVAGGYDPLSEYAYGGFNSLRLVAEDTIRPFTRDRQGMKLGEGYGLFVLERASDAAARGATALARVAGFGESSDAFHLTQPHPEGQGLGSSIREAMASAGIGPTDVGLISLHGTGTPANDAAEHRAMAEAFGEGLRGVPAVAFKAGIGHTLGGAGAVELGLTLQAMRSGTAPPTPGAERERLEFPELSIVEGEAQARRITHTLGISAGFGGSNAAVVLAAPDAPARATAGREPVTEPLAISGVGFFGYGAVGAEGLRRRWAEGAALEGDEAELDMTELDARAGGRRARRMSTYAKLVLAAAREAMERAGGAEAIREGCGGFVGTAHGASEYSEKYYAQIVNEGVHAASPWWFAEGVPNVGSAHLSMELGLRSSVQSVIGTRTAGLEALLLAARRIRSGRWDRAVVAAADEASEMVSDLYAAAGLHASGCPQGGPQPARPDRGGFVTGHGGAALVVEPVSAARASGRGVGAAIVGSAYRRGAATVLGLGASVGEVLELLGDPQTVVLSGNGTWLAAGERRGVVASARRRGTPARVAFAYGGMPEMYAVSGLAAVVALASGAGLPPVWGWLREWKGGKWIVPVSGGEQPDDVAVLSTGYHGEVCGVRLRLGGGDAGLGVGGGVGNRPD